MEVSKKKKGRPCLIALIALLWAGSVFADSTARDLMHLCGFQGPCADAVVGQLSNANASSILFNNAAGNDTIPVIGVDANDDTLIRSDIGDPIIMNIHEDPQRFITFTASSDTRMSINFGDAGVTAAQGFVIEASTADADDDGYLCISGGGADSAGRGSHICTFGTDHATKAGKVEIITGAASTGIIQIKARGDDQRIFTLDGSSDTALTFTWGDGGTTATQGLQIIASTADADDDYDLAISGGGAYSDTRGAGIRAYGNEVASVGGILELKAGNVATGGIILALEHASSTLTVIDTTSGNLISVADTGVITLSKAADLNFNVGLATVGFQEAVAGTACTGTLTANGATPVVTSTTCATTGSRIFTSRTSTETGTVNAWVSAISNGVSFSVTSEAADTGTYNWVIFHESP